MEGSPPAPSDPPPCIYLGNKRTDRWSMRKQVPIYDCRLHEKCTLKDEDIRIANCADCKDRMTIDSPKLPDKWIDPLRITDRNRKEVISWRNMLNGGSAFLVCGGPSLKKVDYKRLRERGIFSLGVNNVAGFAPVSAFVCSDPPEKFHHGIFCDPKIIKFLPIPKVNKGNRGKMRYKTNKGTFRWLEKRTAECPNVWGFERRSWLMPDESWFLEPSAAWGNHNRGVELTGQPKTVCTTLLGLRVLQYLGARKIFLLGVDFHMDPLAKLTENYSFGEHRDKGAIDSNNNLFEQVNKWLVQLRPVFEKFGFLTFNCNERSHLRAFDYVPFEAALDIVRGDVPPEPFDLSGFYSKKTEEKDESRV